MRRGLFRAVLAAAFSITLAACDAVGSPVSPTPAGSSDQAPPTGPAVSSPPGTGVGPERSWRRVALPDGVTPVALAATAHGVVVGGYRPGHAPTLFAVGGGAPARAIPVRPSASSPYAALARWASIVVRGNEITAIGGAPGGAHANTRWSSWAGDATEVVETPQPFHTFGGYGAGALLDAVATDSETVLAGTWVGAVGLDAAVWRFERRQRWVRVPSAGTALANTSTELVGVSAATSTGPGVLFVGNLTRLGDGTVTQRAAAWRSTGPAAGWTRLDLPEAGSVSEASSASCRPAGCVVAGAVDGRYALWWVPANGSPSRVGAVPAVEVGPQTSVPAPVESADGLYGLVGERLLVRRGPGWTDERGPGVAAEVSLAGGRLYAVTADPAALWATSLP